VSKSTSKAVKGTKEESPKIAAARGNPQKVPSFTSGNVGQKNRRVRDVETKATAALILVKILLEHLPDAPKILRDLDEQEAKDEVEAEAIQVAVRMLRQVVNRP
jgi:hypothetical protein